MRLERKKTATNTHGGSWKVAYADFVTAMMSFFLLMWLVNITPDDIKKDDSVSSAENFLSLDTKNGAIGMMTGIGAMNPQKGDEEEPHGKTYPEAFKYQKGEDSSYYTLEEEQEGINKIASPPQNSKKEHPISHILKQSDAKYLAKTYGDLLGSPWIQQKASGGHNQEKKILMQQSLKLQEMLKKQLPVWLQKHVVIETTSKEIRITFLDRYTKSMFPVGSKNFYPDVRHIFYVLATILRNTHFKIRIEGHTDSTLYKDNRSYTNWDLSIDRAKACRHIFQAYGVSEKQFDSVAGYGASKPFNQKNPLAPENRRIHIFLRLNS